MATRRAQSGGWTTKTYKSRWWKVFHPFKYFKAEARKARRDMSPLKALGRVMSVPEVKAGLRTTTTKVNADTRRKQVAAAQKKTAAKKTTAKKAATPVKRASGRAASMKDRVVRNPDGTFNGSKSLPTFGPAEQAANARAWQGYVPPELLPKNARTRRR